MLKETFTLKLGTQEFQVHPLTLRQCRAIGIGVAREQPESREDKFAFSVDQALDIVAEALQRDHPAMTADAILDMELTARELIAASGVILKQTGFVPPDAEPGEAQPGAA